MRIRTILPLSVGLLAAACSGDAPPPPADSPAPSADEQAVAALRETWQQAYNSGDAAAVVALYADGAWRINADGAWDPDPAAIAASLETSVAGSPTITLPPGEVIFMGDMAVTMGTYTAQVAGPDGAPMSVSGTYLNTLTKASGNWRIRGGITNYDSPRPEGWVFNAGGGDAPPNEGTMGDVVVAWKAAFDAGQASAVAELYTEDAAVAFSNAPIVRGRQAIAEALQATISANPSQVTIHDVGTLPIGEEWAVDGGWWEMTPAGGGAPDRAGFYVNLMRKQGDGSWRIHRAVTNSFPVAGM